MACIICGKKTKDELCKSCKTYMNMTYKNEDEKEFVLNIFREEAEKRKKK